MAMSKDLRRLRKAHYELENLPAVVSVGIGSGSPQPIETATVDDIAFAIIAVDQEVSEVVRRLSALKRLYLMAREAGGLGSAPAVPMALKWESR